jgi:hypothetical protein
MWFCEAVHGSKKINNNRKKNLVVSIEHNYLDCCISVAMTANNDK